MDCLIALTLFAGISQICLWLLKVDEDQDLRANHDSFIGDDRSIQKGSWRCWGLPGRCMRPENTFPCLFFYKADLMLLPSDTAGVWNNLQYVAKSPQVRFGKIPFPSFSSVQCPGTPVSSFHPLPKGPLRCWVHCLRCGDSAWRLLGVTRPFLYSITHSIYILHILYIIYYT